MKKIFLVMAVLMFVFAFSGCSVFETDTEALMHPPLLSEEQEKLNAALEAKIGENYVLKYPATGGTNSAFIFHDLDKDGEDEAMAFYSSVDESTRINILKKDGEGWLSVYEAAGFFGEIESIEFAEMDAQSSVLVVKWAEEIGVYRFEKNRLETVCSATCDGANIVDIDVNGFSDIVVFKGTSINRSLIGVIYSDGNEIKITEDIGLHAQYSGIISAKMGYLKENEPAYFIDSQVYDGIYVTEIITLKEGNIERRTIADFVFYDDEKPENVAEEGTIVIVGNNFGKRGIFLRNTNVVCRDINGDGIMEFPVEVREDYAKEKNDEIYYIQYMQAGTENASVIWNGVANTKNGYFFEIPVQWNDFINVNYNPLNSELVFYEKESGEVVLKICTALKSDYQDKYEGFTLVDEDETKNYYAINLAEEGSVFYLAPIEYNKYFTFI